MRRLPSTWARRGLAAVAVAVATAVIGCGTGGGQLRGAGGDGDAATARIAALMPPTIPPPDAVRPLRPAELAALRPARVARVIDGDTLQLADGTRVRMIGINTPESVDPRRPVQEFGREAAELTRRFVAGREVRLQFDVERRDRYGRELAYVFLADGTFVNAELVRLGFAQAYRVPPNVKYAELFNRLQREAREANRGLWARR